MAKSRKNVTENGEIIPFEPLCPRNLYVRFVKSKDFPLHGIGRPDLKNWTILFKVNEPRASDSLIEKQKLGYFCVSAKHRGHGYAKAFVDTLCGQEKNDVSQFKNAVILK